MKNNANPKRRQVAREKLGISAETMSRWPLLTVVSDGMKISGNYSARTLSPCRTAVRAFERFVGFEQSAVSVTEEKFAAFRAWLHDQGYEAATTETYLDNLALVVRFADPNLLASRNPTTRPLFADAAVKGSIEYFLVTEYFPVTTFSEKTKEAYGTSARRLSEFLNRVPMLSDLTDNTLERLIASFQAKGCRPLTVKRYVEPLIVFWKWAASRRLVATPPTISARAVPIHQPVTRRLNPRMEGSIFRLVERYILSRDVSQMYADRLQCRAAKLAKFAGTEGIDRLFTEDVVNGFLSSLALKPVTIRCYRTDIVSLWQAAADEDLVKYPRLRRIRRPKCDALVIECYTVNEARKLLQSARKLTGEYPTGVQKWLYWTAAIMVAWDSGLRRGDIWNLRKSDIREDGTVRVVQHKTKQVVTARLRETTVKALSLIPYDKALYWAGDPGYFGQHFRRIAEGAGVERGSFKWLRRSSASYVDLQMPGAGTKHLGHATPQIFTKHYDGKLGGHTLPLPPELDVSGDGSKGGVA
jgi:site-specific recombinase XerD